MEATNGHGHTPTNGATDEKPSGLAAVPRRVRRAMERERTRGHTPAELARDAGKPGTVTTKAANVTEPDHTAGQVEVMSVAAEIADEIAAAPPRELIAAMHARGIAKAIARGWASAAKEAAARRRGGGK